MSRYWNNFAAPLTAVNISAIPQKWPLSDILVSLLWQTARINAPRVDAEEQIDWASTCALLKSLVQTLVSGVCGTPNLVLERLVDIVLGVRFDHEVASLSTLSELQFVSQTLMYLQTLV